MTVAYRALTLVLLAALSGCTDLGGQQRAAQLHVTADPHALKGRAMNVTLTNQGDATIEGAPVLRVLDDNGDILTTQTYPPVTLAGGQSHTLTWRPEGRDGAPLPVGTYHLAVTLANTASGTDVKVVPVDAIRVTTDRTRYAPGRPVDVTVHNAGDFTWNGRVTLTISNVTHTTPLRQLSRADVTLGPGEALTLQWDGHDAAGNPTGPGQYLALTRVVGTKSIPDQRAPSSMDLRGSATFEVNR